MTSPYMVEVEHLRPAFIEKEASAFSKLVRGYVKAGKPDKAAELLKSMGLRSGGVGMSPAEIDMAVRSGGKHLDDAFMLLRDGIKNAKTWEDYVPRLIGGKVNPVYRDAMRQIRRGKKRDRVGQISGGVAEGFDHLLGGGAASHMGGATKHLQRAAPGIRMAKATDANKGVWTMPRAKGGDSRGLDLYAGARQHYTKRRGQASVLHFDMPRALVKDEAALRRMQRAGEYTGGGSTKGVEYLLPGPVVRKFGRNFRQKKIVAESHPEIGRMSDARRTPNYEAKLPESRRVQTGAKPSKRSRDMPWAVSENRRRGAKNMRRELDAYSSKRGLNEEERMLLSELSHSERAKRPLEPLFELDNVRPEKLTTRQLKRIKRSDTHGDLEFIGGEGILAEMKKRGV